METPITDNKELTPREKSNLNLKKFPKGQSGNPGGRPKNPLKDFQREQFAKMTPKQKAEFLDAIGHIDRWKMAEGNPETQTDITSGGEPVAVLVKFLDGKDNTDTNGIPKAI